MIKTQIIADSTNEWGNRLTTMKVTFPRFILAELNTHRLFSRNSASSRAIPFKKMVESVKNNPFIPIAWQKDHPGMQGDDYFTIEEGLQHEKHWLKARDYAVKQATILNQDGMLTKQLCNRLLETFMWHTVLITASEFENFFKLRCPQYEWNNKIYRSKKDALVEIEKVLGESDFNNTNDYLQWALINKGQAEIHMMALAEAMWDAYTESTPRSLKVGEWHIPFGDDIDDKLLEATVLFKQLNHDGTYSYAHEHNVKTTIDNCNNMTSNRIKIAIARCARVSYTIVGEEDKPPNYENDIKLYDRLLKSGHMSPFEHVARAMTKLEYFSHVQGVYPSREDEWGIVNYELYPFVHKKAFPSDVLGVNPKNLPIYGWSGNIRGFVQHRKEIE